jgi:Fic family protein
LVASFQKKWIWQQPAWPEFTWDSDALVRPLGRVRQAQGEMSATARLLDPQLGLAAQQETLTTEALMTSAIEGEKLDPAGLRSSIARRLGLPTAGLPAPSRDVEGLIEMLIDSTQRYEQPLTLERLHGWQAALFPTGRSGLHEIKVGALRGAQPMRIVSGPVARERIHYEAPPQERLETEMRSFIEWFNTPPANLDGLVRAGLTHVWFELIHPYEDGNGRVGRALLDMALAQDERRSTRFYSMSARLMTKRDDYYSALERASAGSLDLTEWLSWFLDQVEAAMASSEWLVNAVLRKAQFWIAHSREEFNERQLKALNRMLDAGPEGFVGGMTNKKYQHLTGASAATGQRDLADLVEKRCLILTGSGRSVRYELAALLPRRL